MQISDSCVPTQCTRQWENGGCPEHAEGAEDGGADAAERVISERERLEQINDRVEDLEDKIANAQRKMKEEGGSAAAGGASDVARSAVRVDSGRALPCRCLPPCVARCR